MPAESTCATCAGSGWVECAPGFPGRSLEACRSGFHNSRGEHTCPTCGGDGKAQPESAHVR